MQSRRRKGSRIKIKYVNETIILTIIIHVMMEIIIKMEGKGHKFTGTPTEGKNS